MNKTFDSMMNAMGFKKVYTTKSPDANVEAVRQKLLERSEVGFNKYGVTTEREDIDFEGWMNHLQEELLDASIYIERIKNERR